MTFCCAFTDAAGRTSTTPSSKEKPRASWIFPWPLQGGFVGGLFAIFVPSSVAQNGPNGETASQRVSRGALSAAAVELAPAQRAVLSMVSLLLRIERELKGQVRICRNVTDIQQALSGRCVSTRPSHRRRGSNRPEFRGPGRIVGGGTSLSRARLEPPQRVRAWRAVPLSLIARHGAWSDGPRQGTDRRLQPFGDFD